MKTLLLAIAWTFVLSVAGYDLEFAWSNRADFTSWEMNPLARWIADGYGMLAVFGVKLFFVVFAVGVAAYAHRLRHRLEIPFTVAISAIHLMLSLHYIAANLA
jgi:hypothetical protein